MDCKEFIVGADSDLAIYAKSVDRYVTGIWEIVKNGEGMAIREAS
ncbi:MAG: hypothetical protein OSA87_06595 [Woeseiaceae bacterium]|nr:hypothetical protein [Woeseiaceae bacterium]